MATGSVQLAAVAPRHVWLHRFAWVVVIATFVLIVAGGNVTTKGVGMAVPDWPTSLGSYNPRGWTAMPGVRDEHAHRLVGAAVGVLVTALTVWVLAADKRSWVRNLAIVAWLSVVVQGVMGGLRVTEISLTLAIVHGVFAHAFFCMLVALAAVTSPFWPQHRAPDTSEDAGRLRFWTLLLALMAFVQLILGAFLRHKGWGSAAALHIVGALIFGIFYMQAAAPIFKRPAADRIGGPMLWLLGTYAVQVIIGLLAYLLMIHTRGTDSLSVLQMYLRTGHVALGAIVLALSFYIALRSCVLTGGVSRDSSGTAFEVVA